MHKTLALLLIFSTQVAQGDSRTLSVDVWVDNWFEMSVNDEKILEDSVPITTERSFNAESTTFSAELPAVIAIVAKDFKENDTGLEYIGTSRQQMGDGGLIFQIQDASSGETVAVSDSNMRCLVVHRAPLDQSCVENNTPVAGQGACAYESLDYPPDWKTLDFDDSLWPSASEHTERAVRPKDGYDRIDWDSSARLIWSNDLVQDNTLLCRLVIRR